MSWRYLTIFKNSESVTAFRGNMSCFLSLILNCDIFVVFSSLIQYMWKFSLLTVCRRAWHQSWPCKAVYSGQKDINESALCCTLSECKALWFILLWQRSPQSCSKLKQDLHDARKCNDHAELRLNLDMHSLCLCVCLARHLIRQSEKVRTFFYMTPRICTAPKLKHTCTCI